MKDGHIPHLDRRLSRIVMAVIPLPLEEPLAAFDLLDEYRRLGGNVIDMAHVYGANRYALIGRYLRERGRDALMILDKGNHPGPEGNRVSRQAMRDDVHSNLENLGVESVELYALHRDDPSVPAGEIIEWLNELVAEGRVKAFGASNWHHARIAEADAYASAHGLQGMSFSSPNLSLASPTEPMWPGCLSLDRDARDWYARTRFPLFSWSAGGGGFFAGIDTPDVRRVYHSEINFLRKRRVEELAGKYGATPQQIALAWTLGQPGDVWAVVGPRTVGKLRDCVAALELALGAEELKYLERGEATLER